MEYQVTNPKVLKQTATLSGKANHGETLVVSGSLVKHVIGFVMLAVISCGCFELSQRYIFQYVQVAGSSMSPTLHDSNLYLLNRLVYHFRQPKPSEIVVLRDPEVNCYAIKRVVAKPGDAVYVKDGKVFVNGRLLVEPYLVPGTKTFPDSRHAAVLTICGEDQYFVMGDNRNQSADSRIYGAVRRQNILGLVSP